MYKGQGRIRRLLVTGGYEAFRIHALNSSRRCLAARLRANPDAILTLTLNFMGFHAICGVRSHCLDQCSTRAAPDIEGHHRPVIVSYVRTTTLWATDGPSAGSPRVLPPQYPAKVSFVIGIDQTEQSTNYRRPCTTTRPIKRGFGHLSVLAASGPGEFPRVESN